jgi:RNA polymerase primary sigma factor
VTGRRADPESILSRYLEEISGFPLLDPEEERALGRRIQEGDATALRRLVESNLRFVVSFAWRYRRAGVSLLDLVHEGNLGLMSAARRYDASRGNRFLSYASYYVKEAVVSALHRQSGALRIPARRVRLLSNLRRTLRQLERELQRRPSEEEIARESGLSESQVRWVLGRMGGDVSLDSVRDERELARLAGDGGGLEEQALRKSTIRALRASLAELSPRERRVISSRYGLGGRKVRTLQEIAREIHISAERVRQIEARVLDKLRESSRLVSRGP